MLINAENIHKIYKDGFKRLEVLKGVNITINKSEITAIIGPSGAGKSTLLHIIGGLDEPTKGKVLFAGVDIYKLSDIESSFIRNDRIGFVFQFYHLLPEFTAFENVLMPYYITKHTIAFFRQRVRKLFKSKDFGILSFKEMKHRAKELLCSVGLERRLSHRPSQLSGGEAQRVAIARALINNPDIVLCDEPTGNLDSETSAVVFDMVKKLNKDFKQTFLLVTHNNEVSNFSDRVIYLKDGVIHNGG